MITENNLSENEEKKNSNEVPQEETSESTASHDENPHEDDSEHMEEQVNTDISLSDALKEMEKIINAPNAGENFKTFNLLKEKASHYIHDEVEDKKHEFEEAGNAPENFSYEHPLQARFSALVNIFKEKHDDFQKKQEEEQKKNLDHRQSIIERLKNLYTNSEPGTNLFKSIREIKEDWSKAGQVAKSEFKILNNNYFHHLNQFYQMLDLNKEFLEQEYSHNLEKRQHIIARAKELENEPVIQKALNELQYLHKLWKEEAEPVAEEFREKTWEEFKEISNKIHERKSELSAAIETEQNNNLEKKNQIIAEIKKLSEPSETPNHNYWQNAIRKVEDLRSEFLKTGSVPRKLSNQNWNDFKTTLRGFNTNKNSYYKSLKGSQQANLEEKLKLIQTAKDNVNNEDWDIAVPLFKKLQDDWKKVGHVPKSMTNKIWDEFRDACNAFFNNYREKSNASTDNWKENYKHKRELLDELKTVTNEDGSIEKIEAIKTAWNNIGKVPRDKISINSEFNKTLREKLKLNKINELELKEEGLSENQLTDKARKIKSQISDLEAEIVKLENNLSFFNNPSRENPLLRDTFNTIDDKKAHLETLKQNLHSIISGD
ncbi:DUF349 domain-containing protein [Chryseobacterium daecheongense]|uniref:Uncharacterized protein DUF349 n=1 Tax=Chryseobacterium daecheongense TaxID=192389 RepID=A0ABY2FXX8_9FLAO|nr:DUF349 domain-containing protein [Chryseobacterium daecheongense]TDX93385.1 uncharacterized protein DUF349 [Chryseobacterium daecheongense]